MSKMKKELEQAISAPQSKSEALLQESWFLRALGLADRQRAITEENKKTLDDMMRVRGGEGE